MQGDTPGKEEVQPIELDNCNGKADTKRIEQRTRSIEATISSEIAAKFGASAEVLSAEVEAAVGAAMKWGAERSTSIELVAPPGTRMAFQLVWIGDEQVGIVQNLRAPNIPIAFRSFRPTDVRIKSQYDIGCPSSEKPSGSSTTVPPRHTVASVSPKYDCTTTASASRPLVAHDSGEACWLQLVDGAAAEVVLYDAAQITYRTTSSKDDIYFYVAKTGDRLTNVVGATIRPSRFVYFGYGSYENVKRFEIEYHSPGGKWVACLRDANNGFQPLNSVCK